MAMPPDDRKAPKAPRREARSTVRGPDEGDSSPPLPLEPHAPQVGYDAELDFLIRVAAAAGLGRGSANAVNYETLLIGFAFCEDAASRFVQRTPAFKPEALLASRELGLDNNHKGTLYRAAEEMEWPSGGYLYSPSARRMLDLAGEISATVGGPPGLPLNTRHLLAAYLLRNPADHAEDLRRCGLDGPELATQLVQTFQRQWLSERWRDLQPGAAGGAVEGNDVANAAGRVGELSEQAQAADAVDATVQRASARYVASFGADDPSIQSRDLLDVRDEARAFARIAASRNTRLPLSVGVFGEWGSGKTFFMDLMFKHVDKLSKDAAQAVKAKEETLFLSDIVQIKFNAWHYIEINLWASLVEYIFAELDRALQGHKDAAQQVEGLFEQLSTSRLLKLEAIDELVVKRKERKDAEEQLDRTRRDLAAALLRQSAVTPGDYWVAVGNLFRQRLNEDESKRLDDLAQRLGLKDFSRSAASLNEALKEAETEAGRARALGRAMLAKVGRKGWLETLLLVLVVVPVGLMVLKDAVAAIPGFSFVERISNAFLAFSGMATAAAGLVGKALAAGREALNGLEDFRDKLDQAVKTRTEEVKATSEEAKKFAEAERDVARLKSELAQAERKFAEADKLSDQILRDYYSATARGRLNAFIRDKLASGDYAKHLGLIATIRKDFEQLSQIMADVGKDADAHKKFDAEHAEYRRRLERKLEKAKQDQIISEDEFSKLIKDKSPPEQRLFTRIVLYIDDLDRCPSDKVVEVLQAIHLLLYFPLFVVVVAVDARWVSRSLREQYPQLLAENIIAPRRRRGSEAALQRSAGESANAVGAGPGDSEMPAAATSHDYLEKIFQIPYWVRPMDVNASMKYVKGIAEADVPRAPQSQSSAPKKDHAVGSTPATAPASPQGGVRPTAGTSPVSISSSTEPQQPARGVPEPAPTDPQTDDEAQEQAAYVAKSMEISREEHKFLEALAPFVGGTPRRGLRFVNVYRLVKTGLSEKDQAAFQEPSNHLGYRALITQLAIVTGAPHAASTYFTLLEKAAALLKERSSGPSPVGEEAAIKTIQDLRVEVSKQLESVDGSQKLALVGALEKLQALNSAERLPNGPDLLLALERFAPIARRYSFTARPH